mgnify:CR=1 FL=1
MGKTKKERVSIYIEPRYYRLLKADAKVLGRSVSWLINEIFRERISGETKPKEGKKENE